MKVLAVFADVYMGYGHDSLRYMAQRKLKRQIGTNECCVFINRSKTSAKILYHGNALVYYRGKEMLQLNDMLRVPQLIGASALTAGREALSELSSLLAEIREERKRA